MGIYHQGSSTSVKDAGTLRDRNILWSYNRAIIRTCHHLELGSLYDTELQFMDLCSVGPVEVHHVSSCS